LEIKKGEIWRETDFPWGVLILWVVESGADQG